MRKFLVCLLFLPVLAGAVVVKPLGADLVYTGRDKVSRPSCPAPCPYRVFHLGVWDDKGNLVLVDDCAVDVTYTASTAAVIKAEVQTTMAAIMTRLPTATMTPADTPTETPVPAISTTNAVLQSLGGGAVMISK